MAFSDDLLEAGSDIWTAQYDHPFVRELADGTLDPEAFRTWIEQDYRYLLDYARTFAVAATKARRESTMAGLLEVAHTTLETEMDLHREFAAEYGITRAELEAVEKAPTCVAYTSFLVRTAHEGSLPVAVAAVYPCAKGYLDVAEHAAERATEEHRYTPFLETYTGEEFVEVVDWLTGLVDDLGERHPGAHDAMREAFLTSARLEHAFWGMCYDREGWAV